MQYLEIKFLGNTMLDYINTAIIIGIGFFILVLIKILVVDRFKKKAKKTGSALHYFIIDTLKKTIVPALFFGVLYLGVQHLVFNPSVKKAIQVVGIIIFTFLAIRFFISVIDYIFVHYWLEKQEDETERHGIKSIMPVVKIVIYGVGIFFLLDNLGFKISTLLAGLGIGGVAVALAGQTILKDLFSYFAIIFDKPFKIGDFIIVGDCLGTVEHIGIKTTRIRSLGGEQLVFSNADITDSRVRNYRRMDVRRVVFSVGVTYQTSAENLKATSGLIKNIIESVPDTRFDRAHFSSYGDFSLNFEIVYYVLSRDYNKYMDTQQAINVKIYEEFGKRGIEFAYPTQTLFLSGHGANSADLSQSK